MEKIEFPKWIYHKSEEAIVVDSKEQQDEMGSEWLEAPVEPESSFDEIIGSKPKRKKKDL